MGQYNSDKAIKSSKCRDQFNSHHSPYVATTTWFILFFVIVDQNRRSSHNLIDFPDTMVLPELTTRNEITFEFSYIGYATSNDAAGGLGHSASIHNIDESCMSTMV